jgi:hypothetical protein
MARVGRRGGRVVVSDLVVPDRELRDAYDTMHRMLDPSHARAFTAEELEALLASNVGAPERVEQRTSPAFSLEHIITGFADREGIVQALDAELEGGPTPGFMPARIDGVLTVMFSSVAIRATRY